VEIELQAIVRAVALMSEPMRRRLVGVLRIITVNSIALTSGGVSFTAKPVSAYLLGSILVMMKISWPSVSGGRPNSPSWPTW
jgi:hypothetical protein